MEIVKKTAEYSVIKKKSNRYGVKNAKGAWLNGDDKVAILKKEGLITVSAPKKKAEPVAEEAPAATEE